MDARLHRDTNGDETGLLDITDVTGIVPDLVTLIHTEAQENDRYWCSAAHMFFRYAGGTPSVGKSATGYADLVSQTLERGSDGNRKAYIAGTTVLGPEAYSIALLDRFWVTGTNQFFEFQGLPREIEKYAATVADLIGFVTHNAQIAVDDRYFCEETGTMYRYALNTAKVDDYDILKNLTFATVNPVTEGTRYYVTSVAKLYEFGGIPEGSTPRPGSPRTSTSPRTTSSRSGGRASRSALTTSRRSGGSPRRSSRPTSSGSAGSSTR